MTIGTHRVQMCEKPNLKSLSQAHMPAQVSMHTSHTPPHLPLHHVCQCLADLTSTWDVLLRPSHEALSPEAYN